MQVIKFFLVALLFNIYISKFGAFLGIPISLGAMLCFFFIIIFSYQCFQITIHKNKKGNVLVSLFYLSASILIFYSIKLFFYDANIYPRFVAWAKFGVLPMLIFLPSALQLTKKQTNELIDFVLKLSYIPCVLGITQFFLKPYLPEFLLNFSIYSARSDNYMIGDISYFRTNGLIGNPLEYSFFLLIIQAIALAKFYSGEKRFISLYTLSLIATISTLSRFGFFGAGIVFLTVSISYKDYKRILYFFLLMILSLGTVVIIYQKELVMYSNISDRLLSKTKDSNKSTQTRESYYKETYKMISQLPYLITGYPIGTISSHNETVAKEVHDGFWLAAIIEQGVPFFIFYCFYWVYLLYVLFKNIVISDYLSSPVFILIFLTIIGGIVNSAYFNIINCSLIFLLIGFTLNEKAVVATIKS